MAKRPGLWSYIKTAFNVRPRGMLVSPNWVALAAFGLLGVLVNPGFLAIGAGLELGYLFTLSTNRRFQRYTEARDLSEKQADRRADVNAVVGRLADESRNRYFALQQRCTSILNFYRSNLSVGDGIFDQHQSSLSRFLWIFLQLLTTREAIMSLMRDGSFSDQFREKLEGDIRAIGQRVKDETLTEEVKKSLESQVDILKQRLKAQGEVKNKLMYITAELDRIEQQIELLKEQAAVSKDSEVISSRIDNVSSSLGETTRWIKEQQNIFGAVEDITEEPPPILARQAVKE
ncbi:MAG: hypothetical protein ABIJ56_21140 [Pseudomonadota bacterium]